MAIRHDPSVEWLQTRRLRPEYVNSILLHIGADYAISSEKCLGLLAAIGS